MTGLWPPDQEALQCGTNFSLVVFQKLLLQSLSNRLDACKQRSSFLLFVVAQFLSQICLRLKVDLFYDSGEKNINLTLEITEIWK